MKERTDKIITLLGLGIAVVCTILAILFAMQNGGVKELEAVKSNGLFDATYWILIAFVAISIVAILFFLVKKLASKFATEKGYLGKFLMLCGVVVVVLVASYLLSNGNDINEAMMEKFNVSTGTSKLIGAACIVVYIMVIGAALSILVTECAKLFKK
jgi:hypothetical protein